MIYFDVHGTLFEYDYSVYKRTPVWYEEGSHPFANDVPLGKMQGVLKILCDREIKSQTLCRISKGSEIAMAEQRQDVINNMDKHYPFYPKDKVCFCAGDKSLEVGRPLNISDILVDDYQPNLILWARAGGTPVKILNGVNSLMTWYGLFIDSRTSPDVTAQYLINIDAEYNRRLK